MKNRPVRKSKIEAVLWKSASKIGILAGALGCASANAQEPAPFVPIENRARPEYQATPINVGSFELVPFISTELEYVDNLFATAVNPTSDVVVRVRPSLDIRDRRPDRVLSLKLQAGYEGYLDNSVDDRVLLNARGNARFGLGSATRPFFGFLLEQNDTQGRDFADFSETVQPLKLTRYGGNIGFDRDIGNFTFTGEGRYQETEFDGEIILDGAPVDGSLRDFDRTVGRARLAFTRDPRQSFYIQGVYAENNFADPANAVGVPPNLILDRSSKTTNINLGITRQLTDVVQIDVNVGYLDQEFSAPGLASIQTVGFSGNLFWNPTRLTSIQARASREVEGSADPIFAGLLRTQGALVVQHELRRNLVIGGEALYADIQGANPNADGTELGLSGLMRFFVSRRFSLRLRAEYFERTAVFVGDQQRLTLSTRYNF